MWTNETVCNVSVTLLSTCCCCRERRRVLSENEGCAALGVADRRPCRSCGRVQGHRWLPWPASVWVSPWQHVCFWCAGHRQDCRPAENHRSTPGDVQLAKQTSRCKFIAYQHSCQWPAVIAALFSQSVSDLQNFSSALGIIIKTTSSHCYLRELLETAFLSELRVWTFNVVMYFPTITIVAVCRIIHYGLSIQSILFI